MKQEQINNLFSQKENQGELISQDTLINKLTAHTNAPDFNAEDFKTPQPVTNDNDISFSENPQGGEQGGPNQQGQNQGQPGTSFNLNMINEAFIVYIFDVIVSRSLQVGFMAFFKTKVSNKDFALNAEEKKMLEPIMGAIVQRMNIDLSNPWAALAVFGSVTYGSKATVVYQEKEQEIKANQQAAKENRPAPPQNTTKKKDGRGRPPKNKPVEFK